MRRIATFHDHDLYEGESHDDHPFYSVDSDGEVTPFSTFDYMLDAVLMEAQGFHQMELDLEK